MSQYDTPSKWGTGQTARGLDGGDQVTGRAAQPRGLGLKADGATAPDCSTREVGTIQDRSI